MSNSMEPKNSENTHSAEEIKTADKGESPVSESSDDEHCSAGSCSSSSISDADWNQMSMHDILDLEKMAEEIAESKKERISRLIDAAELRQYIPLAEADFEEIEKTDSLLEQAYDLYFTPDLEKSPRVKRKTEAMIARLKSKPHFYCPYEREETTAVHVSRWINKYTSNPEKELIGFTSKDPYEPKRHITAVEPRVSISDTNVVLGKRKRNRDEEDTVCVSKCSSESRLVCDSLYRPKKRRRAR